MKCNNFVSIGKNVMKTVNKYILGDFLVPLGGTADYDSPSTAYLHFVDPNNENEVKDVILNEIKPHYEGRPQGLREQMKLALSYYLTTNNIDFESIYYSFLIILQPPSNAKNFFLWIWDVLFPGENYQMADTDQYVEIDDSSELRAYFA